MAHDVFISYASPDKPTADPAAPGDGFDAPPLTVAGALNASGAQLTNLNAGNVTAGTLVTARGGTGLGASGAAGIP